MEGVQDGIGWDHDRWCPMERRVVAAGAPPPFFLLFLLLSDCGIESGEGMVVPVGLLRASSFFSCFMVPSRGSAAIVGSTIGRDSLPLCSSRMLPVAGHFAGPHLLSCRL